MRTVPELDRIKEAEEVERNILIRSVRQAPKRRSRLARFLGFAAYAIRERGLLCGCTISPEIPLRAATR